MKKDEPPLRSPPQRAIEAAVTGEIARQAANFWSAQSADPQPVRAVQNYVFSIAREGAPAILRLTHESHRRAEEVEAELRWVLDLKERGLPVAVPFRSRRDRLTEIVESAHGRFIVSCFEHLSGLEPKPQNPALWNDRLFEQLGALTARFHQASYEAALTQATLPRRSWREESVAQNFHSYVPVGEKLVHHAFDRVLGQLDALPRSRDAYGLIHADLNHANFSSRRTDSSSSISMTAVIAGSSTT
ncbi:MAG: phosphotransferase [Chthoniobacterales bacterium]